MFIREKYGALLWDISLPLPRSDIQPSDPHVSKHAGPLNSTNYQRFNAGAPKLTEMLPARARALDSTRELRNRPAGAVL